MTMAVLFALALCMTEIYTKGLKPGKNIWVFLLVAWIPISIMLGPIPEINLTGINVKGFWSWQPFLKIIVFAFLFITIQSHKFTKEDLRNTLVVMVWCGFLTSVYEIAQFFWTDQFFIKSPTNDWGRVAGFIGNPTLTAPFVAMLIPVSFVVKKYWMVPVMFAGAIIPDSQVAWISLTLGLLVYFSLKGPLWFLSCALIFLWAAAVYFYLFFSGHGAKIDNPAVQSLFQDHERFIHWRQIFKDWTGPIAADRGVTNNYALTGRGLGSFRFVYHIQNANLGSPNKFQEAHNDYLEFGYATGFIGLGLFLGAIGHMLKQSFGQILFYPTQSLESRHVRALLSSAVIILVSAVGTFIFQIGTTAFYAVVIAGLLHNDCFKREIFI